MNKYARKTDLTFTDDGDFFLDTDTGDLEDTKLQSYRGFIQQIMTRMKASKGEWSVQPDVGMSLGDFVGKRNTAALAQRLESRIQSELTRDGLISPSHFTVTVVPIGIRRLAVLLRITPPGENGQIQLTYDYDMRDNRMVPRHLN